MVLAGREEILADFREALEVAAVDGRTPRPLGLIGPRGVGKTVTLAEIAAIAAQARAWPTVHVEAKPSTLLFDLTRRLIAVRQQLEGISPL